MKENTIPVDFLITGIKITFFPYGTIKKEPSTNWPNLTGTSNMLTRIMEQCGPSCRDEKNNS